MKFFIICIYLWFAASVSAAAQDLSTPEAAVRSFVTAYCKGDFVQAVSCIEGAKYNSAFDAMAKDYKLHPSVFTLSDVKSTTDGDSASIEMTVKLKEARSASATTFVSKSKLHRTNSVWKIVANYIPDIPTQLDKADQIGMYAWTLADPNSMLPVFYEARNKARAQVCLSNIKQLGLAAIMLSQDSDDKFAVKSDSFQKSLYPYLKTYEPFHCPSDNSGVVSYSFNSRIAGVNSTKIKKPEITVLIYEGMAGKLDYKHSGKAGVVLADGHGKMVTQEEAKSLKWSP